MEHRAHAGSNAVLPLSEPTSVAVEAALREVLSGTEARVVDWGPSRIDADPQYHRRCVVIAEGQLCAKFAWSHEAAERIARESRVLEVLGPTSFPAPEIVAVHPDIALFVTRRVLGGPVTPEGLGRLNSRGLDNFAGQLVEALVELRSSPLRNKLAALADPHPPRGPSRPTSYALISGR
jgi:hypothetical protein